MATALAPPPLQSSMYDDYRDGLVTRVWAQWLLTLTTRIEASPSVSKLVALTMQSASIAPTAVPLGSISAGLYRVQWYTRITRAATTSSSLTVGINSTDGTVTCVQSGAALTGNTTSTVQSGVILLRSDANAPISYSTVYASVGATPMQYSLDVTVELMQ